MTATRKTSRVLLHLEELESREVPTVYTVTGVGDNIIRDGIVTFREALLAAETHKAVGDAPAGTVGANTIHFAIPGKGFHAININSALPALTGNITIDATTQSGYVGKPLIALEGAYAGSRTDGLVLGGGSNTVRGLIVDHFHGNGITLSSDNNVVAGTYVGVDHWGYFNYGNGGDGILISGKNNRIGGVTKADRVVIGGNKGAGIDLTGAKATGNLIEGNFIGTDATGFAAIANNYGILVQGGANHNQIGGTSSAARNVISGNLIDELVITDRGTNSNIVQGNFIGPDSTGRAASLSGRDGIRIAAGASNNQIGGTALGSGNLIGGAGHLGTAGLVIGFGIELLGSTTAGNTIQGNWIGVNSAGLAPLENLAGGIVLHGGGTNVIGGSAKAAHNLIADPVNAPGLASLNQELPLHWALTSIQFARNPGLLSGSFKV